MRQAEPHETSPFGHSTPGERASVEEIGPQLVVEARDPRYGLLAYVVVDRSAGRSAVGGVRLAQNLDLAEVAALARAMTLKSGFLGLGAGGAKAGIAVSPERVAEDRPGFFTALGRALGPLIRGGVYIPGEDLGTTPEDVQRLCAAAGLDIGVSEFDGARYAALTVFEGIRRGLAELDLGLEGRTVAIEGFGRVGSETARLLDAAGARVVAVSTHLGALYDSRGLDVSALGVALRERGESCVLDEDLGARALDNEQLLLLDVDVLVPCARPWAISSVNAPRVRARLIVPGANVPLTPRAEWALFARGITCVPDFVANCGTVLAAQMNAFGFAAADIEAVIRKDVGPKMSRVLATARTRGVAPSDVARRVAWAAFDRAAHRPSFASRAALALHRSGGVWRAGPVHYAALSHVRRRLVSDFALSGGA